MKRLMGLLALLIFVLAPATAIAHQGNSNYRSEVTSVRPADLAEGLEFSVVNFDDHVRFENDSGSDVVIVGYDGEPMARILADGTVEVNLNSPSYYLNEDRFAAVDLPEQADAKADPDWEQIGENGIYEWHDHRSHFMGQGTPPQVKDEGVKTKVFDYRIPILVNGEPAKVSGTLTWVGSDSQVPVLPFAILGLAVLAAIAFWVVRRRRDDGRSGDDDEDGVASDPSTGEETGEKGAW